ncbi:RES domain-containing protein [Antricoccus suffuscus]|uniref:RES domain-containing protein n=1 Tax=Antricoccus suffuscus TaxID=1629062 RepID=A0A2T1A1N2_9ACTN|nr:RES family NAD+ phosphorylase [Antricoccus suffuscus]PRZ42520.1 RES domain-containing protein [Antricoccus suffuscus]
MAKLPAPPSVDELRQNEPKFYQLEGVLWRIHFLTAAHPSVWDGFRYFGPLPSGRFDPQPAGAAAISSEGVAYVARDIATALAEVFQVGGSMSRRRTINTVRRSPYLTGFTVTRPMTLLDLTEVWPVSIGASHAINTGRKDVTRAWARAFREAWPDSDGLYYSSSMTGRPCATLFNPARSALPVAPDLSRGLRDDALYRTIRAAALEIGYDVI